MKLRADHWSEGAAAVGTRQGLQAKSFALAAEAYRQAVGGGISAESVRTITEGWGARCEAKRVHDAGVANAPAQHGEGPGTSRLPASDPITTAANVSSDGAMLLIRGEGWKEVKLTAISAVTVTPAAARVQAAERPSRRAMDVRVQLSRHSYQAGLWDAAAFGRQQYAEGVRRGLEQCPRVSSVNDAAEWIERTTRENFPTATQVIDWSHVAERLGTLASAALGEGTAAAQAWVEARLDRLWEGKPQAVVRALNQLARKAPRTVKPLVRDNLVYFQNHQTRMQYDAYRAEGIPIGSGTVESGANSLVHLRMKRPGRGWKRPNGQAMLAALSELNSGRFNRTWRAVAS